MVKQRLAIAAGACIALALAATTLFTPAAHAQLGCGEAPNVPAADVGAFRRGSQKATAGSGNFIGVCGPSSQVLNGTPTKYKYVVGISFKGQFGDSICTGTLLTPRLVLTAAHCGCGNNYKVTQEAEMKNEGFIPVVGRPILLDPNACSMPGMISPGYDLALLKLVKDAEVDEDYRPPFKLAFAMRSLTDPGMNLTVMGYGLTETGARGRRMEAEVPVFTSDCSAFRAMAAGCTPFLEMILSASAGGAGARPVDTCNGDSGGPIFAMQKIGDKFAPILIAVTSRPAPLRQTDLENHCGGGSTNVVIGRTDVLFWLFQNGVTWAFEDPHE